MSLSIILVGCLFAELVGWRVTLTALAQNYPEAFVRRHFLNCMWAIMITITLHQFV